MTIAKAANGKPAPRGRRVLFFLTQVSALAGPTMPLEAQSPEAVRGSVPTMEAAFRTGPIDIDGLLDEAAWAAAEPGTGFIQQAPVEGDPAQEQTEVRVLFDDLAVYVGARLYDSNPEGIGGQLVRRDEWGQYDYFEVAFDPNLDRRTGYLFRVSARNVQRDEYLYDDGEEDDAWDAVWSSAVHRDAEGWTVELRIPLSQMRYEATAAVQAWGVNFFRRRLQSNEETHFALVSQLQSGKVSQFGRLEGVQIARASRLLTFRPYVLSSAYTAPSSAGDPFFDGQDLNSRAGIDLRYGLGAQFTLDATINPDFGQVEADPAVINLTAFETRFEEHRPFFVEDAQVFDFSLSAGQDLYYSRRIGRTPQGRAPPGAEYEDIPGAATILGAAKLTGRTSGGLSAGALAAVTREETGRAAFPGTAGTQSFPVEPRSGYGVFRLQQDFNQGMSTLGGIVGVVERSLPSDGSFDFLARTALSFGVDYEHQWANRTWAVYGYVAGSHVRGDSTAMIRIQRSSNHYRQRPDFQSASLDSSATSLSGLDWRFTIAKQRGNHWTGSLWLAETTPGFEINDLGYSRRQEALDGGVRIQYEEIQPGRVFRSYDLTFSTYHNFSHDALKDPGSFRNWQRNHVSGSFNLNTNFELLNYWEIQTELSFRPQQMDRTSTRGGPLMRSPQSQSVSLEVQTDRRLPVSIGPQVDYEWQVTDAGSNLGIGLDTEIRPSTWVEIEVEPEFSVSRDPAQYVTTVSNVGYQPTYGSRYLFAELERRELALEARVNIVFSPTVTFQLFAQPLLSSGEYVRYRQLVAPETYAFDDFTEGTFQGSGCINGRTCVDPDGTRYVDFDGDGNPDHTFRDRDFNVRSLVGNAVFRWEYRPGSTLFLVWQRRQEDQIGRGDFRFGRDLRALLAAPAENVFMIKLNYWFGL